MERMLPASQPDIAQRLLDHASRSRARGRRTGSIVGPWTARSYLVRCTGALYVHGAVTSGRGSPAKPWEVACDGPIAGITIRLPRGEPRPAGARAGIGGADGPAPGRADDRLAHLLRPGGAGHGVGPLLRTDAGDRGVGHLVPARPGGGAAVQLHTRAVGARSAGGVGGRTCAGRARPVGDARAADRDRSE